MTLYWRSWKAFHFFGPAGIYPQHPSALGIRAGGPSPGSRHYSIGYSNLGHCLPNFSAPRNWGTKGSFRRV